MSKESDKIFLEMKSTSGEDTVNIVEMTTKDLKYDINLGDKAVANLGEIDSNFESCAVGKMLSKIISCYREIVCERKNHLMWQSLLLSYLKELPQPPQPSALTTLMSQQPSTLRQDLLPVKNLQLTKGSDDG